MTFERLWYESSPYLYAATGFATAAHATNLLMKGSGIVLLATSLTVVGLRWIYRHDEARTTARRLDDRRHLALITEDLFYEAPSADARRSAKGPRVR